MPPLGASQPVGRWRSLSCPLPVASSNYLPSLPPCSIGPSHAYIRLQAHQMQRLFLLAALALLGCAHAESGKIPDLGAGIGGITLEPLNPEPQTHNSKLQTRNPTPSTPYTLNPAPHPRPSILYP